MQMNMIKTRKTTSKDFDICFDEHILPISIFPSYYQHALIGLCTSGHAKLIVSSKEHLLVKNQLIVFVPGVLISFADVSSDFSIRYICISKELFQDVMSGIKVVLPQFCIYLNNHFNYSLTEEQVKYFMFYFQLMYNRVTSPTNLFPRETVIILLRIPFFDLYNEYEHCKSTGNDLGMTRKEELTSSFYRLVSEYYKEQKSVDFYAGKLHVTSKYLSKVVKEVCGVSPKNWIIECTLLEIKALLRDSVLNIQEITVKTRFPNQSALGRFFKRHTGMAPSEYRDLRQ